MGYSLAWLAIKNKSPEAVREVLGFRSTGEYEPLPESDLTAAVLPGGWYLIVNSDDDHVAADKVLRELTGGCEAVACFVEEHVMFSQAAGWHNGERIWAVAHASEQGREDLEANGQLPANFFSIRDQLFSQQRTADSSDDMQVDYIFDIPVALAESLTGFRHDGDNPELDEQGFEVLERKDGTQRPRGHGWIGFSAKGLDSDALSHCVSNIRLVGTGIRGSKTRPGSAKQATQRCKMKPNDVPFPAAWWGIGLEDVGLIDTRPDVGTYGRYRFDDLPRPPDLTGDFAWLANADRPWVHIGQERKKENSSAIAILRQSAAQLGIRLPDPFIRFVETSTLYGCVRSNTDCFLDIGSEAVPSPLADGYLVRFFADSQGCVFWYLYLRRDDVDHAVVSSTKFYGTEEGYEGWQSEPDDIVFCAESFEEFMRRFWIENEIWFADDEKRPMPQAGVAYIAGYRRDNP